MNTALLTSFQILQRVYVDKAFSSIELSKQLTNARTADKALITKVVYGVLDTDIELDYIVHQFAKKNKANVSVLLKIGTYCLKYLSIPPYAVVNDVVEISKITDDRFVVGFVNATLKSIAKALAEDAIAYPDGRDEYLSVKHSYPLWALKKLQKDYGKETAERIISTKLPSDSCVRVNCGKMSIANFTKLLEEKGVAFEKTILPDAFYIKGALNIDDSLYTYQSLSSMLIVHALNTTGKCSVLDACAAPGGKAVYIKQLDGDATVTACDIHPHRVALIDSYAKRMGVSVKTVCCDSAVLNPNFEEKFDYVLCDVPCSGFGVLGSRPDIKLTRTSEDIGNLMKLQSAILNNAARYVKRGGVLVYSTCTVFNNENGQIVDRFLQNNPDFSYSSIHLPIDSPANGQGKYQFLPHIDAIQGFFAARLVKN
jgi:16S rRNA (cytosine967-C5)-methyltransferase